MSSDRRPHWPLILAIAGVKLVFTLYASGFYSYFRDELYYIACGRHLDWGFVDHSPLIALYARFGESLAQPFGLRGFRFLAVFFGTARIVLTGVITARLGGNRLAQGLACVAVLFAPIYLGLDSILTMNAAEHLFWLACILIVIEIAHGASEKLWLLFGLIAGIGLQNKHSMLFLGFAIAVALVLTPLRRSLLRPWIYLGGAVAVLIFLPNVIWQWQHGFPTLELLANVKNSGKNVVYSPLEFMKLQVMMLNPFAAPVWMAGLIWLFRRQRVLAWTYIVVLATFIWLEAKDYYVAPIYPMLFAAGAVWISRSKIATAIAFVLVIAGGAIALPLATPILPPERYLAYQRALGVEPARSEVSHTSEMPQLFSDQFGWEEMVEKVATFYHSLPPDVRAKTAIVATNYGEAGAIDFYGRKHGLPPAVCPHQSYWSWGFHGYTGESVILIEDDTDPADWATVQVIAQRKHPYAMPEENGPIFYCTGLKKPIAELWPSLKRWR
ncbi:MAG TPA: glycosyltransferase family 39 protein [Thermoanaerobaculia bacterium]